VELNEKRIDKGNMYTYVRSEIGGTRRRKVDKLRYEGGRASG